MAAAAAFDAVSSGAGCGQANAASGGGDWWSLQALSRPLWACGGASARDDLSDLDIGGGASSSTSLPPALRQNLTAARDQLQLILGELRDQCLQEKESFERNNRKAPREKQNRWSLYLSAGRSRQCAGELLAAVRRYPDCRVRVLPEPFLRSLLVMQHAVSEDTLDFCRPEAERRHCDTFEGYITKDGVNSQLVKDAHRSEWTVESRSFTMHDGTSEVDKPPVSPVCDRKQAIKQFQQDLVTCLEEFLLDFCRRRELPEVRSRQLMQAVTTQMSQAGLANLERASRASSVFVSGQGLEQRTAYNVSSSKGDDGEEVLQLSIYCMKTGFSSYHTPESLNGPMEDPDGEGVFECGPLYCGSGSYLYQYATVLFSPLAAEALPDSSVLGGRVECQVVDMMDEVILTPVEPL